MPVANVMGDPMSTNSPNTRSHTGIIAVRLNSIDMVHHTSFLWWFADDEAPGGRGRPHRTTCRFHPGAREAGFLDSRFTAGTFTRLFGP